MRIAQTARTHGRRASTPTPESPSHLAPRTALAHDWRSCACGGGCPRCKPAAGSPRDAHEREADDVADQVMRMAEFVPPADADAAPNAAGMAHAGGTALPGAVRAFFEPRFGVDFGGVRVHADGESADAAKGLRARAYTIGDDIVFGDGEYAPHTSHGRRLLAHELTHVVQQRRGTASAAPQRKEVPQDKDIRGKQDWTTADRTSNSARWQEACLMNLNAVDSGQYTRIVERRDFYKWFYEFTASQGYTTRWTLAASVVANGAHQIADMDDDLLSELANEELGLANVELRGAMREGNQVIFDVVLPKLKKLLDGGPLKGAAALKWDMQVLAEEQTLIQPLYDRMSKDSLQQLDDIARQSGVVGFAASLAGEDQVAALPHSKGGTVPEFTGAAITDIGARWEYGMALGNEFAPSGTGYVPGTTKMPGVGADYSSGKEFSKVATRSALHQLDAWLTSDPATRVGSGKDIVAIIGKLTESEKQRIVSSRGPGDMPYAALFKAATTVTPAMIKKAMPTDPAFAAAVAQFWTDYASASRGILEDLQAIWETGETLWGLGSDVVGLGSDVVDFGSGVVDLGSDLGALVMADVGKMRAGIAPTAGDLARAYQAHDPQLAGHQQAEGVRVGPEGITVLCTANPKGDGEQTRLIRLSDDGEVRWERQCAPEHGAGRAIASLPNGGFAIAGDVQRSELEYQAQLLHCDAEGQVVASRSFGPRGVTGFVAVTMLGDGSLIAGGMADGRGWLLCVDEALRTRWERPLADVDTVRGLAPLADGGFVLAASQDVSTTQLGMTQLALFTDEQQPRWRRRLPASGRGEPAALAALAADSLVVVGHRSASERDAARCWVLRLDAAGQPLWERLLGPADEEQRGRAVAALADGGVLAAGDGLRDGGRGLRVARLNADGSDAWERSYGGGERAQDVAHGIACSADGGFVLVGSTTSKGPGKTNAWVLRLDGDGGPVWDRAFGCAP